MTLGTCPVGCILHALSRGMDLSPAWAWCHAALPREPHGRRKKEGWAEPVPVANLLLEAGKESTFLKVALHTVICWL